jgi:hypothetical protein
MAEVYHATPCASKAEGLNPRAESGVPLERVAPAFHLRCTPLRPLASDRT